MDTFETILSLDQAEHVHGPQHRAMLKRVFEKLCAEHEGDNVENRENMARIVLMASHANISENELYDLALKVIKRFPQT